MPTVSGTSVAGLQRLLGSAALLPGVYNLQITSQPLPPRRRVGYLYFFTYLNSGTFQTFLVDDCPVYAPGLYRKIQVPSAGAGFGHIVEVYWDIPGLNWTIVT